MSEKRSISHHSFLVGLNPMPPASTDSVSAPLRFAVLITFVLILLVGYVSEPPWKYGLSGALGFDVSFLFLATSDCPIIPKDFAVQHAYLSALFTLPITLATVIVCLVSLGIICILFSAQKTWETLWDSAEAMLEGAEKDSLYILTGKQLRNTLPAVTFILLTTYVGLGITVYYLMSQLKTILNAHYPPQNESGRNQAIKSLTLATIAGICSSIALTPNMVILLTRHCQRNLHRSSTMFPKLSRLCNRIHIEAALNMVTIYPFPLFRGFLFDQSIVAMTIGVSMIRKRFRRSNLIQFASAIGLELALGLSDVFALWRRSPEQLLALHDLAFTSRSGYRYFDHIWANTILGMILSPCLYWTLRS